MRSNTKNARFSSFAQTIPIECDARLVAFELDVLGTPITVGRTVICHGLNRSQTAGCPDLTIKELHHTAWGPSRV
jgi:hypothetical protein